MSAILPSGARSTWDRPLGCRSSLLPLLAAVALFLTKDDVDRYLFAAPILVAGLMIALASWNDL